MQTQFCLMLCCPQVYQRLICGGWGLWGDTGKKQQEAFLCKLNFLPLRWLGKPGGQCQGRVRSPLAMKDPLWGSLRHSRDGCLTPGNGIWFKAVQMAALILHLVSKWCERGQAKIQASFIPLQPWPHPSHPSLFPDSCPTQQDLPDLLPVQPSP